LLTQKKYIHSNMSVKEKKEELSKFSMFFLI
jgi:hypothetical protein